ncbi:hypothetical protein BZA05DRAFT_421701 [Tricharina praecox]|uniref:uncharacterized protein n=1 Tax=Tricharina praecox TaxID=43433 RepID=UPI00221EB9F0|nr:uncharacterized protein BZA05DRAFT_421701 [Tricharina praecox]KAI5844768.1 hypothetical protein BZA05DRAFT_421701 [Tricharina praecox]
MAGAATFVSVFQCHSWILSFGGRAVLYFHNAGRLRYTVANKVGISFTPFHIQPSFTRPTNTSLSEYALSGEMNHLGSDIWHRVTKHDAQCSSSVSSYGTPFAVRACPFMTVPLARSLKEAFRPNTMLGPAERAMDPICLSSRESNYRLPLRDPTYSGVANTELGVPPAQV